MLRLLENDEVTPEEVEGALGEGLEYYLESAGEAEFSHADILSLYESLPLDEASVRRKGDTWGPWGRGGARAWGGGWVGKGLEGPGVCGKGAWLGWAAARWLGACSCWGWSRAGGAPVSGLIVLIQLMASSQPVCIPCVSLCVSVSLSLRQVDESIGRITEHAGAKAGAKRDKAEGAVRCCACFAHFGCRWCRQAS